MVRWSSHPPLHHEADSSPCAEQPFVSCAPGCPHTDEDSKLNCREQGSSLGLCMSGSLELPFSVSRLLCRVALEDTTGSSGVDITMPAVSTPFTLLA